jgi:hypothetical protein
LIRNPFHSSTQGASYIQEGASVSNPLYSSRTKLKGRLSSEAYNHDKSSKQPMLTSLPMPVTDIHRREYSSVLESYKPIVSSLAQLETFCSQVAKKIPSPTGKEIISQPTHKAMMTNMHYKHL